MPRKRWPVADDRGRIDERRRQILDAAEEVFARCGYHRARTREIAEKAGVAEGTIYNYYANKRDLLFALIHRVVGESMPGTLAKRHEADPGSWLAALLHDRLAMLDRSRALVKAVTPEMITDKALREEYLRQVVLAVTTQFLPLAGRIFKTAQVRPFEPSVLLPAIVGGSVAALLFNEYVDFPLGQPRSREALITELVDFFLNGLKRRHHDEVVEPREPGRKRGAAEHPASPRGSRRGTPLEGGTATDS